jgi:hypothetical protein
LIGEVFEVRTQVDHDLSTVSRVDRQLGLNKNLGHHSWLLDDEWDVGQTRAAESGPKLKPFLECLLILIVRGIFNGDGVVTLTSFVTLLRLAFPLCWYIFKQWGRGSIGDELHNVIL